MPDRQKIHSEYTTNFLLVVVIIKKKTLNVRPKRNVAGRLVQKSGRRHANGIKLPYMKAMQILQFRSADDPHIQNRFRRQVTVIQLYFSRSHKQMRLASKCNKMPCYRREDRAMPPA